MKKWERGKHLPNFKDKRELTSSKEQKFIVFFI
ncbi:hypothetical protein M2298_001725 [Brevibacillus sp. 1238]|nr:hypothetical protein [Brevibacillus sp. 1238]